MTGAPIPQGADCVVPFEDTDEKSRRYSSGNVAQISITLPLARDTNIRRAGEDIQSGSTILECGRSLREADIGILASVGISRVPVYRPPRVAIIATGDELTDPGHPLKPGKIYNSNSYSLAALVRSCGAVPVVLGIAGDNVSSLNKSIKRALNYDIVLSTGGVSLGDYDLVKDVLARTGRIDFWTVRMKPGKPLAFGVLSDSRGNLIPHIGLPGNPVSVMVTFELFVRPAIYSMMGRRRISTMTVKATLESEVRNRDGRRVYVRVILSRRRQCVYAKPTGDQGSGILTSMSRADGLAVIPETIKQAQKGDVVDVILLNKEFRIT
jgi:molybdopterin molybdotransferase